MYVLGRMAVPESKTGESLGVPLELLSHLVGRQVPQAGDPVGAGSEHVLRVGRKCHIPNPPLVFNGQFRYESQVSGPPQSGRLVGRRRGEHRRIWAEGALESVPLVRRERLFGLRVESQLLRLLRLRGRSCTCGGRRLIRLLLGELIDGGDGHSLELVHVTSALVRHGGQVNALRVDRYALDGGARLRTNDDCALRLRANVPQVDIAVLVANDQVLLVWMQFYGIDGRQIVGAARRDGVSRLVLRTRGVRSGAIEVPHAKIPDFGRAILASRVHPAGLVLEPHVHNILQNSLVVDNRIGVVALNVEHLDMLVSACSQELSVRADA